MIILYPIFFIISILLPRNKKIWVFGYVNRYNENTKYFFEYASKKNDFSCYWLANNKKEMLEVKALGYKSVLKKSFYGYWLSSRANLSFITLGYSDVNRLLALNSHVINFWHGTPIKKIYLDSKHDLSRFGDNKIARYIARKLLLFLTSKFAFYYSSNELERELVCKSANIPLSKSKSLGSPRFEKLLNNPKIEKLEKLKNKYKKIILYAPTWRDDSLKGRNLKLSTNEYDLFNKKLQSLNTLFIIKPHPRTDISELLSLNLLESENIIYSNNLKIYDINNLYYYSDMLITDISSAMFDYLIFNRPIIMFMPDIDQYLIKDRGIYNYFEDTLRNYAIKEWIELFNNLDNFNQNIPILQNIRKQLPSFNNVNKNIYNDIVSRFY